MSIYFSARIKILQVLKRFLRITFKILYRLIMKREKSSNTQFLRLDPKETEMGADFEIKKLGNFEKNKLSENKIAYSILIHNRYEYLKDCLETLLAANYSDLNLTLFLIDDGSTDPRVHELLDQVSKIEHGLNIRIYKCQKTLSTSGAVTNRALKIMFEQDDFDVVGFGDPDCLYHPDWLQTSLRLLKWLHENYTKSKVGMVSSYNSKSRDFHRWVEIQNWSHGRFVAKKQMGWPSILTTPLFIKEIGPFHETPEDETLFTKRIESLGYLNFSTEMSYLEHVGQSSLLNNYRPTPVAQADHSHRLVETGWGRQIYKYQNYSIQRDLRENVLPVSSDVSIDVIIPVDVKDLKTLPITLESVRENLNHPIASISIISQKLTQIERLAKSLQVEWIDEREIVEQRKSYFDPVAYEFERSGWLYQQFLKLSVDKVGSAHHKFILDADNVFIGKQAFEQNGKILQPISRNYHASYFESYSRLMGKDPINHTSAICHFMMIKVDHLRELRIEIERKHNCNWKDAIYGSIDLTDPSGFSEYELYGHYVQESFPSEYQTIIYEMLDLPPGKLRELAKLKREYSEYRSIGFQQWMK
jgi:glycosyltransferase involved in cell wall biosynthesis